METATQSKNTVVLRTNLRPEPRHWYFCGRDDDGNVTIMRTPIDMTKRTEKSKARRAKKASELKARRSTDRAKDYMNESEHNWLRQKVHTWFEEFSGMKGFHACTFPMFRMKFPSNELVKKPKMFRQFAYNVASMLKVKTPVVKQEQPSEAMMLSSKIALVDKMLKELKNG